MSGVLIVPLQRHGCPMGTICQVDVFPAADGTLQPGAPHCVEATFVGYCSSVSVSAGLQFLKVFSLRFNGNHQAEQCIWLRMRLRI